VSLPDGTAALPSVKVGGEQNGLYSPATNALGVVVNGAEVARFTPLAEGGSSWARKNAVIGGDFSTNPWQRGVSFAGIANGAYSADRWAYGEVGDAVHTITRSVDAPTVAQAGRLTNHCFMVDCTTVDAAPAAGDYVILQHKVEGYNFSPLAQRTMTISFWHKHTKTGTYCVAFVNSGLDRSYVIEYTQDVTDTWEYHSATITASPSAGTWDYSAGIGAQIVFTLAAGSTFQTTANAWQTGNFLATANQVNAADNTANNFRIALVQLEAGSVATEFESRTVQEELELCQRYYQKTYNQGVTPGTATGVGARSGITHSTTLIFTPGAFPVRMRAAPTMALWSANGTAGVWNTAAAGDTASAAIGTVGESGLLSIDSSGLTAANGYYGHWAAAAEL
jgi:hypothetical protein